MSAEARAREWRSTVNVQTNWWETFFEGVSVDMWIQAVPPEHTVREADRLEGLLGVGAGAEILDVPCGGGRLALAFAERGYRLTGVDWSTQFLDHARSSPEAERVGWERRDMRDLPWRERFDAEQNARKNKLKANSPREGFKAFLERKGIS